MVKHLLLIRHAQAEAYSPVLRDQDRDLTSAGIMEASRIGKLVQSKRVLPSVILASPARRAIATAELLAAQLGFNESKIKVEPALYESSMRNLIAVVNQLDEQLGQVIIVSHNPTLTYLAEYLTHEEIGNLPTCGVVNIQFENLKWVEVSGKTGKLVWFEYPGKNPL